MKKSLIPALLVICSASLASGLAGASETSPPGSTTQAGPNILGIRLGMTPGEVRKILEARPGIKKVGEVRGVLMYQPASGQPKPIPNSGYINKLVALPGPVVYEDLSVRFTPTAGRERAVSIIRRQTFLEGQQPTIDVTVKALVEKYGPFSYKRKPNPLGVTIDYFWRFDSSARLLNGNTDAAGGENDVCANPADAALEVAAPSSGFSPEWFKANQQLIKVHQELLSKYEKCGQTQVFARLDTGGARADASLVRSLSVNLSAWVEAVAARRATDRYVQAYEKGEIGKGIGIANQRKPEL